MEGSKLKLSTILACFLFLALFFIIYQQDLTPEDIDPRIFAGNGEFGDFIDLREEKKGEIKKEIRDQKEKEEEEYTRTPMCDTTTYERTNVCQLDGDVRVQGSRASIFYVDPTFHVPEPEEKWRIRPYPRKEDDRAMNRVREVELRRHSFGSAGENAPRCEVRHEVPGVVFANEGYAFNFYHDFTDFLLPLFLTTRKYEGEVKFVVTNMQRKWMSKYKPIVDGLTNYQVIDFDNDKRIHCFDHLTVGLVRHKEFGIHNSYSPYSMIDFAKFLRVSFSLDRDTVSWEAERRKPRLLLLSRKRTRKFMNVREIAKAVEEVGYELVVKEAEHASMKDFVEVVNSCDVMMGVLGAGLTNMLFLPTNATLLMVVPWGKLESLGKYCYGSVAGELGLRYIEYSVAKEESSLVEKYPMDHPLFTDPKSIESIHRQGWSATFNTFMYQDVRVNVKRLKVALMEAMKP